MIFKSKSAKETKAVNSNAAMTFICEGTELLGEIKASGNLRVDGTVRGNVHAKGDIEVSASGTIEGKSVTARNVIIHGRVKSTLIAEGQIRIHSKGEMEGDVTAQSLDIESGASFIGYSHTGAQQVAKVINMEQKS
ncbi:MAG: polymer-forming cytoskeletal protein [Thiobacillus sp.]